MKIAHVLSHCFVVAALQLFSVLGFGQGSLTPPSPPAPTMQTLDQLGDKTDQVNAKADQINGKLDQANASISTINANTEKRIPLDAAHTPGDGTATFIIAAPGSYYLTANLIGSAGKSGISIQSDNVTVDLNGFALTGGSASSQAGVGVPASHKNISVRNGVVTGWGNTGVDMFNTTAGIVDHVRASDNGAAGDSRGHGISVGSNGEVNQCLAQGNSRLDANHVNANTASGIEVSGSGNLIVRNDAHANATGANYKIAANNRYGPIVDITAGGAAAVNANSAADTTTTTNPWANFTY